MDWTNIMTALITSGAFTAIYLIGDRKTSSVLDNVAKTIEQWRGLLKEVKEEADALRAQVDAKDRQIDQLYKSIGALRDRGDKLSSRVAYLNAFRCKKIQCIDREPPFGSVKTDISDGNDKQGLQL
jgi:septal ring factor EnvC (AmiA/AmiB activator)|nr:MAG TPA: Sec-independent protein translocase protein tatAd protein, PROTEIN TRANSPORT [Caudoviricetes sp.]